MQIGGYELISEVGRGAAGVVYRARSPEGRLVAVKVIRIATREQLAHFARERRLLATLGEREGFVPLLDSGGPPAESHPYLVMPFLEGGTLRERLRGPRFAVKEAVRLGVKLAVALGAAHARGIVHRDLKPENVLFTASGEPLVADLGLAKHFDRSVPGASQSYGLSQTGELVGTVAYMPPEQALDAKKAGPPADVFALGAIVYELLSGRPAFAGRSVLDVAQQAGRGHVTPIARASVPRGLEAVLRRALEVDPAARFADGASFAAALRAVKLDGSEKGAAPRSMHRVPLVVGGLLVAGGLAAALLLRSTPPPPSPPPPIPPPIAVHRPPPPPPPPPVPAPAPEPVAPPIDATAVLDEALEKLKAGDSNGAVALCAKVLLADPNNARAYSERAKARFSLGDLDGALADDDRAIALDPKNAAAWNNRGVVKFQRGDFTGAVDDESKAIEIDPRFLPAWRVRAVARQRAGDLDGANADCTKVIELEPRATSWVERAALRTMSHDLEGAIADATKAIELDPWNAAAYRARAPLRAEKGDKAGAVADYERLLELSPGDPNRGVYERRIEELRRR